MKQSSETAQSPPAPPGADSGTDLVGGRLLARNTLWTLLGQASPLVVAIFAIPPLIQGLGAERFGLFSLSWVLIGYFSLLDLGLGRALTQLVAERLGRDRGADLAVPVWTSLLLMLMLSLLGAILLGLSAPSLIRMLRVPAALEPEALRAFVIIAAAVPVVVVTAGLAGVISAYQKFGALNALRIPFSMFSFLGPLMVLPLSSSVAAMVGVQLAGRIAGLIAHAIVCGHIMPALRGRPRFDWMSALPLLRFGGWMTVSNVLSPLMVSLDRFLIGAWNSLRAVTYYVTPYEVATKLCIIPSPLVTVLFPAFATSSGRDREHLRLLFFRGTKYLLFALFPVVLVIVALAREGLSVWLGPEFASQSTRVLQLLTIGVFANSLAQMPYALLQGVGLPRRTAVLHLIELPLYLLALKWLIERHGIEGAAIAWLGRTAVDAICLFAMAGSYLGGAGEVLRRVAAPAAAAIAAFGVAMALEPLGILSRGALLALCLGGFAVLAWSRGLVAERRALIQGRLASSARGKAFPP